jgi:copper chaperone CopZ
MKFIHRLLMAIIFFVPVSLSAQIQSVSLQASGLTCSMCSRAIYKSIQKVEGVANVQEDIEHSSYHIRFSDPSKVSPEKLQKAVSDAGFSVAWMELVVNFRNVTVSGDSSYKINDLVFNFVDVRSQTLNGDKKLLIIDKNYLSEKDRRKYLGSGDSGSAGEKGANIFHVTLKQS